MYRKHTGMVLLLFSFTVVCAAQKVDKYCELFITRRSFNRGVNVLVDIGQDSSLFSLKDKTVKEKMLSVNKYSNLVDALNYMSLLGWKLINTVNYDASGSTANVSYYFTKSFDAAEFNSKFTNR